jgi:catechol 2,3-dioxygenase-like lactoylglutathione lyase family enzyme
MKISPMIRAALNIENLERSRAFYENVLGLKDVFFEGPIPDSNVWELVGAPKSIETRVVILKAKGPTTGMVGLFEITNPLQPRMKPVQAGLHLGEVCLVFYCDDLDEVTKLTPQYGGTVVCPPVPLLVGEWIKQREMTLRDPDGIPINLIEWDPDSEIKPEQQPGRRRDA